VRGDQWSPIASTRLADGFGVGSRLCASRNSPQGVGPPFQLALDSTTRPYHTPNLSARGLVEAAPKDEVHTPAAGAKADARRARGDGAEQGHGVPACGGGAELTEGWRCAQWAWSREFGVGSVGRKFTRRRGPGAPRDCVDNTEPVLRFSRVATQGLCLHTIRHSRIMSHVARGSNRRPAPGGMQFVITRESAGCMSENLLAR